MSDNNLEDFYREVESRQGKVLGKCSNINCLVLCSCASGHMFYIRPSRFLAKKNWCNLCSRSAGEKKIERILDNLRISFLQEYRIPELKHYTYDFFFSHDGRKCLLEYDGIQHFQVTSYNNREELIRRQYIDRLKDKIALQNGYFLIRIDYTQYSNMKEHIKKALRSKGNSYYSSSIYSACR